MSVALMEGYRLEILWHLKESTKRALAHPHGRAMVTQVHVRDNPTLKTFHRIRTSTRAATVVSADLLAPARINARRKKGAKAQRKPLQLPEILAEMGR
ncbi:MAG: hypothetical protein ACJ8AA_05390 [Gemmatimonadaceae bacterium]